MTHTEHQDETAIRTTIAEAERVQSDVEPFVALHTADAVIVNVAGRRVAGHTDIRAAMSHAMNTSLAQVRTRAEVRDVRFVAPDVAVVSCTKHISDGRASGEAVASRGSLTYVVVREPDRWRIALAQTTPQAQS